MTWLPMDTAPKDGRPVWARGNNFGDPVQGQHYTWCYWDGLAWKRPMHSGETFLLLYLVEWMPMALEGNP